MTLNPCDGILCHVHETIEVDFSFGLQQGKLCNSDLSGLKLSVNIVNPCSKLLTVTEEKKKTHCWINQISTPPFTNLT